MKCLLIMLLSFLLIYPIFSAENVVSPEELQKWEDCEKVTNHLTQNFIKKMYSQKSLVAIGTGGGSSYLENGLRMLSVEFEIYQKSDIQQARMLLIECVEAYLEQINKTIEFKQYASSFPFDFKNISIGIYFTDKKSRKLETPPSLAVASADEGKLRYSIDPDPKGPLKTIRKETYQEAYSLARLRNYTEPDSKNAFGSVQHYMSSHHDFLMTYHKLCNQEEYQSAIQSGLLQKISAHPNASRINDHGFLSPTFERPIQGLLSEFIKYYECR